MSDHKAAKPSPPPKHTTSKKPETFDVKAHPPPIADPDSLLEDPFDATVDANNADPLDATVDANHPDVIGLVDDDDGHDTPEETPAPSDDIQSPHYATIIQDTPPDPQETPEAHHIQLQPSYWGVGSNETKDRSVYTLPVLPQSHFAVRYRSDGPIAKGGMSTIQKAFDHNIKRHVAMKILDPAFADKKNGTQRFLEEAQITGQLEHPNIPPIHELGQDDQNRFYFTMKLIQGKTLSEYIASQNYDPGSEKDLYKALLIFQKVCDALSYAHSLGVIHRDLKPDNIMLGSHGQIYLMDWGVCRLIGEPPEDVQDDLEEIRVALHHGTNSAPEKEGTVVGTVQYMAPEQALGKHQDVDVHSDIFSLGAILYEMLTKRPPYCGGDQVELLYKAQNALAFPPQMVATDIQLPPRLCEIVTKAMSPDPQDRYPNVPALQEDLELFLRGREFPKQNFKANTLIITEGESGNEAYIITRGHCQVHKIIDGRKKVLKELGPGEVFGETAFFSSQVRTANVETLEPVTVKVVEQEAFTTQSGLEPWMGNFVTALAERFRSVDQHSTDLQQELNYTQLTNHILAHFYLQADDTQDHPTTQLESLAQTLTQHTNLSTEKLLVYLYRVPYLTILPHDNTVTLRRDKLKQHLQDGAFLSEVGSMQTIKNNAFQPADDENKKGA